MIVLYPRGRGSLLLFFFLLFLSPKISNAEILALVTYESKLAESLKSLKLSDKQERKEGILVIDVDPEGEEFGKILMDIPIPAESGIHKIFFDRTMTNAYVSARNIQGLLVFNLEEFPYRLKKINIPGCKTGQNLAFSDDNNSWVLTCSMSQNIFVGQVSTNQVFKTVHLPDTYPHGVVIMSDINRILVTSSSSRDFSDRHDFFTVVELDTGKVINTHKVSSSSSSSPATPSGVFRTPNHLPPSAYISNMFGDDLWFATWDPKKLDFNVSKILNFRSFSHRTPLNLYFGIDSKKLYITTANPGGFHIFDISSNPKMPILKKSLRTAEGANNAAFTNDGRYSFVQNSLMNLPKMSDGSITVIDLKSEEVIGSITTLKKLGLNPTSIILLPKWNYSAQH